jgi:hypothetical protein
VGLLQLLTANHVLLAATPLTCAAGILASLPAASSATSSMLKDLHRQQQLQLQPLPLRRKRLNVAQRSQMQDHEVAFSRVLDVAANQLELLIVLLRHWPASSSSSQSSLSSSKELGIAALPALQLAMEVLDASGGKAGYAQKAVKLASELSQLLQTELQGGGSASTSSSSSSSQTPSLAVLQVLHAEQLLPLLAAQQALFAQVLRRSVPCGGSSSSRTGVALSAPVAAGLSPAGKTAATPAAAAEAVLKTVGLSWTCSGLTMYRDDERDPMRQHQQIARMAAAVSGSAAVIQYLEACPLAAPAAASSGSSSSSSSSGQAVSDHPQQLQ